MNIDWSNAGTSAGFQASQSQIAFQNGKSTDDVCEPAIAESTGDNDDYNIAAEIVFGIICVDAIAVTV